MRHMHSDARPLCALTASVEMIGDAARSIYGLVDCADCLRRAIAEGEERIRALRELLAKVGTVS